MTTGSRETETGVVKTSSGVVATTDLIVIIDDFETDSSSAYNSFDSNLSFQTTNVIHGSQSLEADNPGFHDSVSTSGLNSYFAKGEEANVWFRWNINESYIGAIFGAKDSENYYYAQLAMQGNDIRISRQLSSSYSTLASSGAPLDIDTWYRLNIKRGDGNTFGLSDNDLKVEVFSGGSSLSSVTVNDSNFASEDGVGFISNGFNSTGNKWWMDYYHKP